MKPSTTNKVFTPALTRLTAALVIAGQLAGLSAAAYADTATDIERRMSQRAMVQQAVYQLVAESRDADSDGAIEPPAMRRLSGEGPSDGGVIPDTSGAPKTDGFGGMLGYCAWDTGTVKTGSNMLPGGDGAGAVTVAVLSYGLDNTFQTSCAHLAAGLGGQGDDYVFWMTANQVVANSSTNVSLYWGAPVASDAVLQSLDKSTLHDGEVRLVQDTNQLYRWHSNAATWALVGQPPSWQATTSNGLPAAYFDGKIAVGQTVFGQDMLTVNGKTFGALGLRGDTPLVGTSIYDKAGNNVKAFLGYHQDDDKLVLSAATGSLAIQVGGNERMLVRADGSLALNGATVFDAQRNLSANRGSFAGNVDAPSFSVGGVSVLDSGRNLLNIGSISAVGPANVNSLLIAGTLAIDSARSASLSGLTVGGAARVDGTLTANGGIITSNLVSTGQILGASGSVSAPGYSFMGNSRSGMYVPAAGQLGLAVDGSTVFSATPSGVLLPTGLSVTGGNFVLSGANTSGLLANRPAPGVAKRVYVSTDSNEIFLDTGSAWQRISATELAKLTDVALSAPTTGQILAYNAVTGKWANASVMAGSGVNVTSSSSGITVGLPAIGTAGSYGSETQVPVFTTDAQGRVVSVVAKTITPAWASITGKPTTVAGYGITDINSYAPTLTGAGATGTWGISVTGNAATATKLATARSISMTGDGTWSTTFDGSGNATGVMALASTGVSAGSYGSATQAPTFTVDGKGRLTAAGAVTITPAWTSITGKPTTVAGYGITDINAYAPTLTGAGATGTWDISVTGSASRLTLADTRYVVDTPDSLGVGIAYDFKHSSASGLSDGGSYSSVMSLRPWYDWTGGPAHQLAFTPRGNMWIRSGNADWSSWSRVLRDADIGTTVPSIKGEGATGTWDISVSGSADYLKPLLAYSKLGDDLPRTYPMGVSSTFVSRATGWHQYGSVTTVRPYSGGGGTLQLYAPYSESYGGSDLMVRLGNYDVDSGNSWTGWKTLVDSQNIGTYAPALTGEGATGTWGISVAGNASTATKLATTRAISMTGDGAWSTTFDGSGDATGVMALASTGVTAGSYGSATQAPTFTVDGKGRLTAAGAVTITPAWSSITGKPTTVAGYGITDINSYAPTLTGTGATGTWGISVTGNAGTATKLATARSISMTGDGSWSTTFDGSGNATGVMALASTGVTAGSYGSATQAPTFTVDGKGRLTAAGAVTITPAWTSITGKPTTVAGYGITDINAYAPTLTGTGATGTWGISVTGNAGTATKLATARTISMTGDGSWSTTFDGSGNSTGVMTLANSGVTAGAYGTSTDAPTFTVDAKGRLTAAGAVTITPAWTSITGKPTTVAGYGITDINAYAPTLTGTGATGTWGISVTGNAGTATKLATARTISMTGDGAWSTSFDGSGNATGVLALASTGVTAGSYGSATAAPTFTVDGKGRLTAAGAVTITPAWSSITGKPTTVAGYGITDINAYAPTLTGTGATGTWGISVTGNAATATKLAAARSISMTGDGTWTTTFDGSANATGVMALATTGVTAGSYGSATQIPTFTVDAKGRLTAAGAVAITPSWSNIVGEPTTTEGYGITDGFIYRGLIADGAEDTEVRPGIFSVTRPSYTDTLINFPSANSAASVQLLAHYDDELWFRVARDLQTNWDGMGSRTRRLLNSGTDVFAAAMNQHVRTTDSPTFAGVTAGTFNGALNGNATTASKLATARTISMTGDGVWSSTFDGSGNATGVMALASTGVSAGGYGSATQAPTFTVDGKGRLTAAGAVTITPAWTSITGKPTTVAGYGITDINTYAPTLAGTGATGTWGISVTGNAATATKLATARSISMTGDGTWSTIFDGSGNATGAMALASTGVTAGSYGSATQIPSFTVDAKGRLTAAGAVTITPAWSSITGTPTTVAGYGITDINSYAPTLTGVGATGTWGISVTGNAATATKLATPRTISMTGDGTWSTTFDGSANATGVMTLANTGVTAGSYGSATQAPTFTVDGKGRLTAAGAVTITPAWSSITGKPTTVAGYGITDINSYAPTLTGTGATGTWGIGVTGNAATATKLATPRAINGVPFDGSADIAVSEWVTSKRDFVNGTLITTNIDYSVTNGDPWVMEIRGNSYGNLVPFDIQVQGYIWNNSLFNVGGYSNGSNIPGMVALNNNGRLSFWFPRQTYWQGFSVRVYVPYPGVQPNRVTAITDEVQPAAATKLYALSPAIVQSLHSGNFNTYAPTLTGSGATGTWGVSVTGNAGTATMLATARTINMTGDGTWSATFDGAANATGVMALASTGVTAGSYGSASQVPTFTVDGKGRLTAAGAVTITPAWTSITGTPTTVAGYGITDINSYAPTLTGTGATGTWGISVTGNAATATKLATPRSISMTGDGTWSTTFDGSANATGVMALASTGVTAGSYGSATQAPTFTVDAKGRLTAAGSVTITPAWTSITGKPTTLAGYGITDAIRAPGGQSVDMSGTNLNNLTAAGFYRGSSLVNAPDSGWWYVTVQSHDNTGGNVNGWTMQTVTAYGASNSVPAGTTYSRYQTGTTSWTVWTPSISAANLNSYAPSLTGTGASGTWGISVTGSSDRVRALDSRTVDEAPSVFVQGAEFDFKTNTVNGLNDGGTYNGVMTLRPWGTTSDWSGGPVHQLGFTSNGNLWQRTGTTAWGTWNRFLKDSDIGWQIPSVTGSGATGTWNIAITGGAYSATRLVTPRTISMTGDGSWTTTFDGTANVTGAMTLANSGVTAGSYGSATQAPTFTVDAKGRLTAAGAVTITPAWSSITGKPTTLAGYGITDSGIVTYAVNLNQNLRTTDNVTFGLVTANGGLNVTGNTVGDAFRADQGAPTAADNSTNGYAFGADGDTGLFSPIVGGGGANGIVSIYTNNAEAARFVNGRVLLGKTTDDGVNLLQVNGTISATALNGNATSASKLNLARTISMTGDGTWSATFDGSGNVTGAMTLANTGVTAGTYGSSTQIATFTVDAKGRITAAANATFTPTWASISGKPTTVAGYGITDISAYAPTLSGVGAYGTWNIGISGNAASATTALSVQSQGTIAAETSTTRAPDGLTMRQVYANGYPDSYGNLLSLGGAGESQLMLGWSGTTGAHADNFVRSMRDVSGAYWSPWAKLMTDVNIGGYAPSLTGAGASGTWNIAVTGNAATATKLATPRTISMTGDGSWAATFDGSGNVSGVMALANTGVTAGSYGSATTVPVLTVDAKGRLTAANVVTVTPAWTSITGAPTTVAGYGITDINSYAPSLTGAGASGTWNIAVTGNAGSATKLATARTISITGDATWSTTFDGSGNATGALTLANTGVTAGSYGSASMVPVFTVDAKGRLTAAAAVAVAPGWASITGKPTTVAGYGITDAMASGGNYNLDIASNTNTSYYYDATIELRELNHAGAQTGALSEAPRLAFHWGGRVASQIALATDGTIMVRDNPGTGYEKFAAGNITANGTLTTSGNASINGLTVGTWSGGATYRGVFEGTMSSAEYLIMSGGTSDVNTYVSAKSGGNVNIRPSANNASAELSVTVNGVKLPALATSGAACGLPGAIARDANNSVYVCK